MRHDFIDRYSRIDSPVHRLPTGFKLGAALTLLLLIILLPPAYPCWGHAAAALGLLGAAVLSRIPWKFLLSRLLLLEPFVLGVALLSLLQPGGGRVFLFLVVRGTLCLFTVLLLSNTTPFSNIVRFLRRAGAPSLLVTTLALMYRYIFLLIDEAQRMKRARASRTFRAGRFRAWKSNAGVIAQLFVRSTERAERIYAAMCARGWKP